MLLTVCAGLLCGCSESGADKEICLIEDLPQVDFDTDSPVGQITRDVRVTQSFVSATDTITSVQLYGATYMRENTATINIRLELAENGDLIDSWIIDSSEMEDNTVITLDVHADSPLNVDLKDKECLIVIESPDGEPESSPTFWMTQDDIYPEGQLTVGDYPQYNDLWFQVIGTN